MTTPADSHWIWRGNVLPASAAPAHPRAARGQVQHRRGIKPAFSRSAIGEVSDRFAAYETIGPQGQNALTRLAHPTPEHMAAIPRSCAVWVTIAPGCLTSLTASHLNSSVKLLLVFVMNDS